MVEKGEILSVEDVLSILALPLIGVVPEDDKIITSTNDGEPIYYNDKSLASEAYKRIAKRLLGEKVPMLDLSVKKGFFKRLFG
jgi:septum site-determining protein MinD